MDICYVHTDGLKKIDRKTLENVLKKDIIPETREKLLLRLIALRGLIRRVKGRAELSKDKTIKEESYKEWKKAEKELTAITKKLKQQEIKTKVKKRAQKGNKWLEHVQQYYNNHDISYKEALLEAAKTWVK